MAEASTRNRKPHRSTWGLLNNYRYLHRKTMMIRAVEIAQARGKSCQKKRNTSLKRNRVENPNELLQPIKKSRRTKSSINHNKQETDGMVHSRDQKTDLCGHGHQLSGCQTDLHKLAPALGEIWEVDSGFSSETSPPASGRSSPCRYMCPTTVVALDCEMVGTGPGGRCSEVARCSILDYHGNIIYDKYICPCQPVTDYRTRWSGIQKHHLKNAVPFEDAREEILGILQGKVVVGHSIFNDFKALYIVHPSHMIRDTCGTCYLTRLAGYPHGRHLSLKKLANQLLNRKIQVGRQGHSSVEDALACLDLYKLVEGEWEQKLQEKMMGGDATLQTYNHHHHPAASSHFMEDEYWPEDITQDGQ